MCDCGTEITGQALLALVQSRTGARKTCPTCNQWWVVREDGATRIDVAELQRQELSGLAARQLLFDQQNRAIEGRVIESSDGSQKG